MGYFRFAYGEFEFQYKGSMSFLSSATFGQKYDKIEVAKRQRDYLYSLLKDKYADDYLGEYTNAQGFKCYQFGINPNNAEHVLGEITLHRSDNGFFLFLTYGPIHYIYRSSDF